VATNVRMLAQWACYLGNCLAQYSYPDKAEQGRIVLLGLRGADGRLLANVELRATRHAWRLVEVRASGTRPIATALAALQKQDIPGVEALTALGRDETLPGALRCLARQPEVNAARNLDLAAIRIRVELGRLLREAHPTLDRAVANDPVVEQLCAMALAVTVRDGSGVGLEEEIARGQLVAITRPRKTTVPGYPSTSLAPGYRWALARGLAGSH
jgi:hypothetical protein